MTDQEAVQQIAEMAEALTAHESRVREYRDLVEKLHAEIVALSTEARDNARRIDEHLATAVQHESRLMNSVSEGRTLLKALTERVNQLEDIGAQFPEAEARLHALLSRINAAAARADDAAVRVMNAYDQLGGETGVNTLFALKADIQAQHEKISRSATQSLEALESTARQLRVTLDKYLAETLNRSMEVIQRSTDEQMASVTSYLDTLENRASNLESGFLNWQDEQVQAVHDEIGRHMERLTARQKEIERTLTARLDQQTRDAVLKNLGSAMTALKTAQDRGLLQLRELLVAANDDQERLRERMNRLEAQNEVMVSKLRWLPFLRTAATVVLVLIVVGTIRALSGSAEDEPSTMDTTTAVVQSPVIFQDSVGGSGSEPITKPDAVEQPVRRNLERYLWVITSVNDSTEAERLRREQEARGCEVRLYPTVVGGTRYYRVGIEGPAVPAGSSPVPPRCASLPAGAWPLRIPD